MKTGKVRHAMIETFAAIALLLMVAGCGGGGSSSTGSNSNAGANNPVVDKTPAVIAGRVAIRGISDYSGVVIVAEQVKDGFTARVTRMISAAKSGERMTAKSAMAAEGVFTTTTDKTGSFRLPVPEGTYSVSAFKQDALAAQSQLITARTAATTVTIDFELVATGRISGVIHINGSSSGNLGIIVFIPGTSYSAVTDDAGNYNIINVPIGTYSLTAGKDQFSFQTINNVIVTAAATSSVTLINLTGGCSTNTTCNDNNANTEDLCATRGTNDSTCLHFAIACSNNAACNDSNAATADVCENPGSASSYCTHPAIACTGDGECDDSQVTTKDMCVNPGSALAACYHISLNVCETDADCADNDPSTAEYCDTYGIPHYCYSQAIQCSLDSECNDNNPNSFDYCLDYGQGYSACNHTCSADSYCNDNDTATIDECINPGSANAYCQYQYVLCDENADCDDLDPASIDECIDPGTIDAYCQNTVPMCLNDADCNDSNPATTDDCENPGTVNANCTNTAN